MRLSSLTSVLLFATSPAVNASWLRDVARPADRRESERNLRKDLLDVATPLGDYRAAMSLRGITVNESEVFAPRKLEQGGENHDDYYLGDDATYSMSGYSLKYAKCQPVQYFDDQAIEAGLSTPMSKVDIVVLRLCPQDTCDSSSQYGCFYNYGEYAVNLNDYLRIMLKYSAQKREYVCAFCDECLANGQNNGRRLDEDAGEANEDGDQADENQDEQDAQDQDENAEDENGEQQNQEEENEDGQQDDQEAEQQDGEGQEQNQEAEGEQQEEEEDKYAGACDDWNTYCTDYEYLCDADAQENNQYMNYEGYLNYLGCTEAKYNGYAYFVRPRCDGSNNQIKMAVYYDQYCAQYAGNDVSIKDLGLGFSEGTFYEFYSGSCIDCSAGNDLVEDSNSLMCNNVHFKSASCTTRMQNDLFASDEDESTDCSFIESLRTGTYDKYGQLNTMFGGQNADTEVTKSQKIFIALSALLCVAFIIYACYLHHSMTNLLIKSLSHRELLPPSRHTSRTRRSGSKVASSAKDWQGSDV